MARIVNFFWWVDVTVHLWLWVNVICVCGVLVMRRWGEVEWPFWAVYIAGVLAVSVVGYFRSRQRYVGLDKGLSRLDRIYKLDGALCAASQGVVKWPARVEAKIDRFDVTFNRIHASFALSFLVLAVSLYWPIERDTGDGALEIVNGPHAWGALEEWLNVMDASELLEEETLDSFEEKLDALEDQPRDDWYSEGSLEATDFLMKQSEEATLQFLESLEMAMQSASRFSGDSLKGPEGMAAEQLGKSLESLDMGKLALREDLMEALSELAKKGENGVDQESLKQMLDRMKDGAETVSKGLGIPRFNLVPMQARTGPPGGEGVDGEGPVPLTINNEASPNLEGTLEGVSNDDRERAILGDTTFTSEVRIDDFKPADKGPQAGNRTHNLGEGGSAVWRSRARPKEQTLLKQYFSDE